MTKTNMSSVNFITGCVFIFICTIPWFGLPFLDSQPWPVLSAVIFLFTFSFSPKKLKIPKIILVLSSLIILGLFFGSFMGIQNDFELYRGITNYSSLILYSISYLQFYRYYGFPLKILVFSNILWITVAVIQLFIPDIVSTFVALRTTEGRGVTSLAPEPTYFAIYLFFSSWLLLLITKYKPDKKIKFLILCNLLAILLLAKSAMVSIFLAFVAFILIIQNLTFSKRSFSYSFVLILVCLVGYISIVNLLPDIRLTKILKLITTVDPSVLIGIDASINARFASIVAPVLGFFQNLGFPGGLHSFDKVGIEILESYGDYYLYAMQQIHLRIMSWNGALIYELGIFGVLIWIVFFKKILNQTKQRRYELYVLFIILFSAIPLAFPLIPMILTALYFSNNFKLK